MNASAISEILKMEKIRQKKKFSKHHAIALLYFGAGIMTSMNGALYSVAHKGPSFIGSYLHDISLPFSLFMYSKLRNNKKDSYSVAAYILAGCSAFEIAQYFHLYRGTYDPNDFLAYTAGIGLALAFDKIAFKGKNLETLAQEDELIAKKLGKKLK